MSERRVVITGLGILCPVGNSVAEAWENILAGRSGIGPIEYFDVSQFSTRFGGTVKHFDVTEYIPAKEARKMDPFIHYGIAAACQAFDDAGLEVSEANAEMIGVAIGAGIGGITGIENGHSAFLEGGPRRISPFFVPANIINMISGNFATMKGLQGPNFAVVSACATSNHNIGEAARIIRTGDAEVMIAGGAEYPISPTGLGGFAAARALSRRNDDPQRASRPWDKDRDGFVLSEGAGVVVLESLEHARARGARIYAELIGYGASADAYHMTQPPPHGDGAARCMRRALRNAGIAPEAVDYINAHGTSTPAGDLAETRAIKQAFGEAAYRIPVSSTKSMTGHLLGAAGGIEAIFTILALRDQVLPPTINLDEPDEECDLDYVPHTAREAKVEIAISNSFGFGGTNSTLIFKRFDG
ncbi:3-oxoacyl-[acyl-carrier-protein] synthase II [Methylomarinovum caldicuralii]|uniref:3-oxoacyl-[acyl-carrier-protein] synthase 2 n=1 Tax=Methylomarinovum caldicuralii TaxID=438856 RepID=A0AAU9C4Y6_9GAMM|nr:beta-ketoacyl-ACP synthase II [Methylomarinovum caldicuralii]BCX82275.1 3-oxoacyl-[acyl-carrier-protein] synthase II [Methylomarinovum caldicuralii]